MRATDVDSAGLREGIRAMAPTFRTKDLSEHAIVQAEHRPFLRDRNYHAIIGAYLSAHEEIMAVRLVQREGSGGATWERVDAHAKAAEFATADCPSAKAAVPGPPQRRTASGDGVGPQSIDDPSFRSRMRLHQSRWRADVLEVPWAHVGNRMRLEDGERGLNFLTPEIFGLVQERLRQRAGLIDRERLLANLLSSQPLCFNLFGPLALDLDLATTLMATLLPGEVAKVSAVRFEHAPQPALEYLNDGTAFDAFIDYEQPDGKPAFIGFEVKLTEPFSPKHYPMTDAYRRWMRRPRSPWRPDAEARVTDVHHNQLWRDHVLAIATRDHVASKYAAGRLGLVRHAGDTECGGVVGRYRALLETNDDTFLDLPLDRILDAWAPRIPASWQPWLRDMRRRYLEA